MALKMKKSKAVLFAAVLCLVMLIVNLSPIPVRAAGPSGESVRVGYYENEVFQEGASPDLVKTGYAYEYYQKLSEYTGWRYEYVYGEFGDLYQMLLDGEIDFLAGLAWREDREAIIGFPEAAMGNETYSLVKHDIDSDITLDTTTLNGRKIGVLDSAMVDVLQNFLKEHSIQAEVVKFNDYEPLFQAFDKHEIDVLAAEGDGAYGRDHAELLCPFGTSEYYLCVAKSRPDLLAELNTAQTELAVNEPNYINNLRNKYYPVSISSRAFSDAEKQWLEEHDELVVGYLNNYLPYSDTDANGAVTGLVKDYVPKIVEQLGIQDMKVTYKGYDSYDAMISDLEQGNIDTAFPVGGGLFYSEENGIFQSTSVISAATEIVYSGEYTDDTLKSFAVNENNRMQYYFVLTYYPDAKITFYPSTDACLKAVGDGEVGCTTLNGLRANDILRNNRYKKLSQLQTSYQDDRCFGVQIGNAGLLRLLNRGISLAGADYAQNLAFRYTDQLYNYTVLDMLRDNMALFGTLSLVIAAIIIALLVRDTRRSKREITNKENARKELEKANAELREQQHHRDQQDKMITALASDYRCVYHIDLDTDDAVCYRADPTDSEQPAEGKHFPYHEFFANYAKNHVAESYREGFIQFIDPDNIRKALAENLIIVYRYLAQRDSKEYYEM
ncbi:MAG: transporter substrate-binding domain-containing protein, partial [Clostridiales bacterium]|nr:transporter substrate-binding domain-containing protein [Clostridiales bacterium]